MANANKRLAVHINHLVYGPEGRAAPVLTTQVGENGQIWREKRLPFGDGYCLSWWELTYPGHEGVYYHNLGIHESLPEGHPHEPA